VKLKGWMSKLTEVFWEFVPKNCSIGYGMERLQNFREDEV